MLISLLTHLLSCHLFYVDEHPAPLPALLVLLCGWGRRHHRARQRRLFRRLAAVCRGGWELLQEERATSSQVGVPESDGRPAAEVAEAGGRQRESVHRHLAGLVRGQHLVVLVGLLAHGGFWAARGVIVVDAG